MRSPRPELRAALADARFVFTAIRVGQDRARTIDEQVPLKYGVLGQETTGPGGFAMAMRTIPAMLALAGLIEEVAPDALMVNFTNPVGIIMQALGLHGDLESSADLTQLLALGEHPFCITELADHLLGRVPGPFHGTHLLPFRAS